MTLTNSIFGALQASLTGATAMSGTAIGREEYPYGTNPPANGYLCIKLEGGSADWCIGDVEERVNFSLVAQTRGDSTFAKATEILDKAKGVLESPNGITGITGGTFIDCRHIDQPRQVTSKPIDTATQKFVISVQVDE